MSLGTLLHPHGTNGTTNGRYDDGIPERRPTEDPKQATSERIQREEADAAPKRKGNKPPRLITSSERPGEQLTDEGWAAITGQKAINIYNAAYKSGKCNGVEYRFVDSDAPAAPAGKPQAPADQADRPPKRQVTVEGVDGPMIVSEAANILNCSATRIYQAVARNGTVSGKAVRWAPGSEGSPKPDFAGKRTGKGGKKPKTAGTKPAPAPARPAAPSQPPATALADLSIPDVAKLVAGIRSAVASDVELVIQWAVNTRRAAAELAQVLAGAAVAKVKDDAVVVVPMPAGK